MKSLPPGRAPISTHLVPLQMPLMQDRLFSRIAEEVAKGHQVYVVCPRISEKTVEDDAPPIFNDEFEASGSTLPAPVKPALAVPPAHAPAKAGAVCTVYWPAARTAASPRSWTWQRSSTRRRRSAEPLPRMPGASCASSKASTADPMRGPSDGSTHAGTVNSGLRCVAGSSNPPPPFGSMQAVALLPHPTRRKSWRSPGPRCDLCARRWASRPAVPR